MYRMIKKIAAALLGMILLFHITACESGSLFSEGDGQNSQAPVTISVWHVYGGQADSPLNDLVNVFNRTVGKEQGICVQVTLVSNTNTIHDTVLAAANNDPGSADLPDLFISYPKTVLAMPDQNILVDYRDYFSKEELAAFIPEFLDEGMISQRLVILPVAKSTEIMFVNKTGFDRFAQATGASIADLETWESLYQTAEKYTAWTDAATPDVPNDGKSFFVHDYPFNYFQVGVQSLGKSFFADEEIAFGSTFQQVWEPYAHAALSGALWLGGGYATEPLRTGDAIVSVASSASVLYYYDMVTYPDNTSEKVQLIALPCPIFAGGEKLVMQRGAGFCTLKSTPEREAAAVTFLKWLTEPKCNTEFVTSCGYMPVTQEAFSTYLAPAIDELDEPKYVQLYQALLETQAGYTFYTAPQFPAYLSLETWFDNGIRNVLRSGRSAYLAGSMTPEALGTEVFDCYDSLQKLFVEWVQ